MWAKLVQQFLPYNYYYFNHVIL